MRIINVEKMKEIKVEEMKKLQIEILNQFCTICINEKFRYYLAGGTLLGAIRHKGFIPWDDDIDVSMPRNDYNRFISFLANNNNKYPNLTLGHYEYNKNYMYPFLKIINNKTFLQELDMKEKNMGICIDVFPIDGRPNKMKYFSKKLKLLKKIRSHSLGNKFHGSKIKKIILIICDVIPRLIGPNYFSKLIDKYCQKYQWDTSDFVGVSVSGPVEKDTTHKSCYDSTIKVTFEGKEYNAPVGYDEILRTLYGNYMELPPVEKRVTHHDFKAYWKDKDEKKKSKI